MFKNLRVAWTVTLIAVVVAVMSTVKAQHAQERATVAEGKIAASDRLAHIAEGMEPAQFVRADQTTITYRASRQVERDGQTFIDYVEQTAAYGAELEVFGPSVTADGYDALAAIPEGKAINIRITPGTAGATARIDMLYVAP